MKVLNEQSAKNKRISLRARRKASAREARNLRDDIKKIQLLIESSDSKDDAENSTSVIPKEEDEDEAVDALVHLQEITEESQKLSENILVAEYYNNLYQQMASFNCFYYNFRYPYFG